jgi:type I restriction enzyme, S subunit
MNEDEIGYPIYRMNEIHNMLCDLDVNKYADILEEELNIFKLNDKDVLFNRTNSYEWVGRTGLYRTQQDKDFIFASYLVRFVPDENIILPEYLTTFLSSKFGVWDIKRRARHSINQTNVNPEEVKEINIPLLDKKIQEKIRYCFENAYVSIIKSNELYIETENLLLKEFSLDNFIPPEKSVSLKSFKNSFLSSGRLDAEYYQPKYDELFNHIKKTKYEYLGSFVEIKKSIEPGSEAYQDNGIPFIRVANLNKFGIEDTDIFLDREKYDIKDLKPKKDSILFSKDGSVGIAYKLETDLDAITSGALLHLKVKNKDIFPDYLTLVLNSKIVQMQAERDAGGSIIQHWKPSEIEKVLIPILNSDIQKEISELIKKSFELRNKSKQLRDIAIKSVEIAIEKSEQEAINFLKNELKN